jgi:outer membrane protein assembly factor BamA
MENVLLSDRNLIGFDGGISSGIGFSTLWDTRDNIFYPTTGGYYEMKVVYSSKLFGSDYDFNNYEINFRRYQQLTGTHILAIQFYMNLIRGYPPFYELARLGGQNIMRGYYEGRYSAQNYFTIQTEYRTQLFWRLGAVLFLGIGDVENRVSDYSIKYIKPSYGFGIRYMMDEVEKLNLRVDVGFGKGTMGVYFSIEEAF